MNARTPVAGPILAALVLAGCAYDPPMQADHTLPKYQSDLAKCQKQAAVKAAQTSGATPQASIKALFTSDEPEHQDVRTCMAGRGYH